MPKQLPRIFTQVHLNDIMGVSTVSVRQAVSGDVVRFYYKSTRPEEQVDPQPLVLVIQPFYQNKLYGVNLNYLDGPQVERLWNQISVKKLGTIKQLVESNKRDKPLFRARTNPSQGYYSGTLRNILSQVCGNPSICYRSYSLSKIGSSQLVDYNFPGNGYVEEIRDEVIGKG